MTGMYSGFTTDTGDKKACSATFQLAAPKHMLDAGGLERLEGVTLDAGTVQKAATNKLNRPDTNPDDAMRVRAYNELKDAGCEFPAKVRSAGPSPAPNQ